MKSSFVFNVIILLLTACSGPNNNSSNTQPDTVATTTTTTTNQPNPIPTTGTSPTGLGSSCHSSDSTQVCLGLKYVIYRNTSGNAVASQAEVLSNLAQINSIWSQCKIAYQIDEFVVADPTQYNLNYSPANTIELDSARSAFSSSTDIVVITTGTWNRSGTLGNTGANAWTTMPGGDPLGSVIEAAVATFAPIYAHEIGHQLNLNHVSDTSDVMTPIISSSSLGLTASQCSTAQAAVTSYWSAMLR